mmetsp:Transcript_42526/g.120300  ORF Transcript_42526/g.120300 Transcript_42526/m.120300 type:complete len:259 (+) Transcript_42526:424-1200(+)
MHRPSLLYDVAAGQAEDRLAVELDVGTDDDIVLARRGRLVDGPPARRVRTDEVLRTAGPGRVGGHPAAGLDGHADAPLRAAAGEDTGRPLLLQQLPGGRAAELHAAEGHARAHSQVLAEGGPHAPPRAPLTFAPRDMLVGLRRLALRDVTGRVVLVLVVVVGDRGRLFLARCQHWTAQASVQSLEMVTVARLEQLLQHHIPAHQEVQQPVLPPRRSPGCRIERDRGAALCWVIALHRRRGEVKALPQQQPEGVPLLRK